MAQETAALMVRSGKSIATADHPHRRLNPLTGEWVLVSPHRAKRPWAGQVEANQAPTLPSHDPTCPLCPGNARAGGLLNPDYQGTFIFENDFAALTTHTSVALAEEDSLFRSQGVTGETRVICFSEDHARSLPELSLTGIRAVIDTWALQIEELAKEYPWVQVFENKGAMMGSSQPHPHGQIWASSFIPNAVAIRDKHLCEWFSEKNSNLLVDYLQRELVEKNRIVVETEAWVALVPYWAAWPFETMLLPKTHRARFDELTTHERDDLALALKELTTRYDNLFDCSFPYSMGWHFAPFDGPREHWQLNAVFYPPLLRSATVRKFMVGYEMLAEAQRDITPEQAAERLRTVSDTHYKTRVAE